MTSPFAQAISICGLSQKEAAYFLGVSLQTIKSWSTDRRTPPDGAWAELAELYDRMDHASDIAHQIYEDAVKAQGCKPDNVEFSYSGDHGKWPSTRCAMTVESMARLRILSG